MKIRETDFSAGDYQSIADVIKAADPDEFLGPAELAEDDRNLRHEGMSATWFVAETDDPIGVAAISQSPWIADPASLSVGVFVRPQARRRGVGRSLLEVAEAAGRSRGGRLLRSYVRDDVAAAVGFVRAAGFARADLEWEAEIDPQAFDARPWRPLVDAVESSGIELTTVAALRSGLPDWFERTHALASSLELDIPTVDPIQPEPASYYRGYAIESIGAILEGFFVARDGAEWVGLTQLRAVEDEPTILHQDLTGVVQSHRRRGIGTALKVVALEWAQRHGYTRIRTENAASNAAMLAINRSLGYTKGRPVGEYHKELHP